MATTEFLSSFLLGLATPLTAVCVLPLYPGFISYLSKQFDGSESRRTYALFGSLVVAGVMSFMLALGVVFSTVIQTSLTGVIEIVSPIAFGLLGVFSIALILNLDFHRFIPESSTPRFENPLANAFGFGFFFGAVIIPCNPAFIATFFARAFLFETPLTSLLNFSLFGLGIGFPLMIFSLLSSTKSQEVISLLQKHEELINRGSGLIMLTVSVYYLVFVFGVFGL